MDQIQIKQEVKQEIQDDVDKKAMIEKIGSGIQVLNYNGQTKWNNQTSFKL